jgi:poly-gamma-glutamate synthesis protein (capsule biosynthesis protein)
VLGHHPHVLQSVERYKGGLIAYSLGNLLFDMAADGTYETAALRFVVSKGRLNRVDIIPLRIARGTYAPAAATLDDAERRIGDIRRWSARFGTEIVPDGSTGHVFF